MTKMGDHPYDDILNLARPESADRPRMPLIDRAAQFSPFAALTGYDAAIQEAGRLTEDRILLSEDSRMELDRRQQILTDHIAEHPQVIVTWFIPDEQKEGGAYTMTAGSVKKIDQIRRVMILTDGTRIPADNILSLESKLFET